MENKKIDRITQTIFSLRTPRWFVPHPLSGNDIALKIASMHVSLNKGCTSSFSAIMRRITSLFSAYPFKFGQLAIKNCKLTSICDVTILRMKAMVAIGKKPKKKKSEGA
jgi:hypothetical protein